jgi:hypothetical protein
MKEGGMRKYRLLQGMTIAALACLGQSAVAGSADQACQDDTPVVVSQPQAATPAIAPVAIRTEAAPRSEREPAQFDDRTRTMSYIILRGLQGAGPFLGSR